MFVSISSFDETPEQLEEGMRHVREEVVPSITGAAGLRHGYWAVDRDSGRRVGVMVWDSPEAAGSAMPEVAQAIKRIREAAGRIQAQRSPDSTQRFELFAEV